MDLLGPVFFFLRKVINDLNVFLFDLDPVELILIGNYSYCKHSLEWFCFGGIKIQRITMIPDFTLGLKFVYGLYT